MILEKEKTKILFSLSASMLLYYLLAMPTTGIIPINLIKKPLEYSFNSGPVSQKDECNTLSKGQLEETPKNEQGSNNCWWLDSGGVFSVIGGIGQTIQNELPVYSQWQMEYLHSNPTDTDGGVHPQNIFRLINKKDWNDTSIQTLFKINKYNISPSINRNESNGVLLMSRYIDNDNLYYAGLRVDGNAVIKKKINGQYTTLAIKEYEKASGYDRNLGKISLPLGEWIGQKLTTKNNDDGSVNLTLFIDIRGTGSWEKILEVVDRAEHFGSPPLYKPGKVGIRSDFMDVEFSNFKIELLNS